MNDSYFCFWVTGIDHTLISIICLMNSNYTGPKWWARARLQFIDKVPEKSLVIDCAVMSIYTTLWVKKRCSCIIYDLIINRILLVFVKNKSYFLHFSIMWKTFVFMTWLYSFYFVCFKFLQKNFTWSDWYTEKNQT